MDKKVFIYNYENFGEVISKAFELSNNGWNLISQEYSQGKVNIYILLGKNGNFYELTPNIVNASAYNHVQELIDSRLSEGWKILEVKLVDNEEENLHEALVGFFLFQM